MKKPETVKPGRHHVDEARTEGGYDLRTVQELLGHNDVKTPLIYTHVLNRGAVGVHSPVDRLAPEGSYADPHKKTLFGRKEMITIEAYNPDWPHMFRDLGVKLRDAIGPVALRIDHIGSTSIPGLAAKPIIDIQISVAEFEPMEAYRVPLENLGFQYRDKNPELTKRYFKEPKRSDERTHIHVRRAGSFSEQFPLLFRDYMRRHSDAVVEYAKLKRTLAEQFAEDRLGYTEAKTDFIWNIMKKADRWAQDRGWKPGPSDA